MSMQVGMQENVAFNLKAAEVNGQPVLNIVMSQPQDLDTLLDFETATTEGSSDENTNVTLWSLKKQGYENGAMVDTRSPLAIMKDVKDKLAQLTAFLELYTPKNNFSWNPFENLDVNTESLRENLALLQDDDLLALMSKNIYQQAVNVFKEYGDTTKLFRVPLIRVSKKNANPKLRDKNLDKQPIAESMDVPLADTKVGYTKYEIDNKLNDPTPLEADQATKDKSFDDTFGAPQVADPKGVPAGL